VVSLTARRAGPGDRNLRARGGRAQRRLRAHSVDSGDRGARARVGKLVRFLQGVGRGSGAGRLESRGHVAVTSASLLHAGRVPMARALHAGLCPNCAPVCSIAGSRSARLAATTWCPFEHACASRRRPRRHCICWKVITAAQPDPGHPVLFEYFLIALDLPAIASSSFHQPRDDQPRPAPEPARVE